MCEFCTANEYMEEIEKDTKELKYIKHHTEKELNQIQKY